MFDLGVIHLIECPDIHRPRNAITLSYDVHQAFGKFKDFLRAYDRRSPHTYRIGTFRSWRAGQFPITRTFFAHPSIDPPSERLLALHSAISHILHLSDARWYIDQVLRNMEDGIVREDGSTQLGLMLRVALQMRG